MKIWAKTDGEVSEGKYLVVRRDGTIPKWGHFVISTIDPAASGGLRGYADAADRLQFDPEYVASIRELADDADRLSIQAACDAAILGTKGADPDAPPHRRDNPAVVAMMRGQGDLSAYAGPLTIERLVEIIDPEAMDGFEKALAGCIDNGQPVHLAHQYACSQFGLARDAAFAKAKAILALGSPTGGGDGR